jgi:GNAT superfamily N-acetyltransferase
MAAGFHARVAVYAPAATHALAAVDTGLGDFNASESALDDVRPLHVVASDASGSTIGGAIGRTWGGCCELQQFWVAPAYRGHGIGSRLLEAFECEATLRGCSLAYLDTFSFHAPSFYARRGYVEVLRVTGFTGNVAKITMHKRLQQHGSPA